jgi:uncharacterized FAD-dependent dehydrogenase
MLRLNELRLPLDHAEDAIPAAICAALGIAPADLRGWQVARRGYDARQRHRIMLVYTIDLSLAEGVPVSPKLRPAPDTEYRFIATAPARLARRPVVIGAGPCGLLAALTLARMGFRPIVLERGRVVRERTKDTWGLWRRGVLDPDSNVQFGEGGAGTFSDGKLYSGIKDPRHLGRKVLTEFVAAGAPEEVLYVSKPHIGTFRLVTMVEHIRRTIEALGGEYRFESKVTDLSIAADPDGTRRIRGLTLADGTEIEADQVVLAIGHSARETFSMLQRRGVAMEAKPFSIGFRIEHPQSLIDRARFGAAAGDSRLGAADYKLVHHASNGRAVYSFCMCPGGRVVAAASEPGRVVTNGMSQYSRAEFNANAGIVVAIDPGDFPLVETPTAEFPGGALAGVTLQRHWESQAFVAGGGDYRAPGQRVEDFLAGRASTRFGDVAPSYKPGVTPADLAACLPSYVIESIREALPAFDRQVRGFALPDAVLTGVETRTSAPVRIGRGPDLQSVNTRGLFPAGEGCGYAGGILSAGVDGIRVAEAVAAAITGAALPQEGLREGARQSRQALVYG